MVYACVRACEDTQQAAGSKYGLEEEEGAASEGKSGNLGMDRGPTKWWLHGELIFLLMEDVRPLGGTF